MIKKAFTMIELVFVIVVMGIVASIGAEIIVKLYDNFISTKSLNKLQFQTDLVLNQISKRLTHRIKDSVIGEKSDGDYTELSSADGNYIIIAWVGKSYESSLGNVTTTGWSGFVDLESSDTNETEIKTDGSHLEYASDIIYALSYETVDINTSDGANAVLIFKGKDDYNVSKYGWGGSGTNDANYTYNIKVKTGSRDILEIEDKNITTAYEQYSLSHTAYAIVPSPSNSEDFNLTLYYNFQPWDGESYRDGNQSTLIEHVSSFSFVQHGETIRLKLCIRDDQTLEPYGFCKEKVVF